MWNNKEQETRIQTCDNQNLMSNVALGMSYVHTILVFIEKLS